MTVVAALVWLGGKRLVTLKVGEMTQWLSGCFCRGLKFGSQHHTYLGWLINTNSRRPDTLSWSPWPRT